MTALLSRDGTNFSLACDRCGHLVARLADTASRWDPAWDRLRQHGWTGAVLPTGPHACPSCTQMPAAPRPTDNGPGRPRPAPARWRRSSRITVSELPAAVVVEVRGPLSAAVTAALYEVLLDRSPRRSVIVDLSRATALDSRAIDVLVQAQEHAERNAVDLCLVGLSEPMRGALRLLCLTDLLRCFANRRQALTWLGHGHVEQQAATG